MKTASQIESSYDAQARAFLSANNLKMRIAISNSKPPPWEPCGNHYVVTISQQKARGKRLTFDFWGSRNDADNHKDPTEYDVLACISSDAYCPDTFEDFCGEYGYDTDSRSAEQTFNHAVRFARQLRHFFTEEQIEALSQIQ